MKLPEIDPGEQRREREVSAEIIYIDQARQNGTSPFGFEELTESERRPYILAAAAIRMAGERLAIMDEYDADEKREGMKLPERRCMALADALLEMKDSPRLSFVDFIPKLPAEEVVRKIQTSPLGELLAPDDEQLGSAPFRDEEYVDITKAKSTLTGVSLRVYGWEDEKMSILQPVTKTANYEHVLAYPSDERRKRRELSIGMSYDSAETGYVESLHLSFDDAGHTDLYRKVYVFEYGETGYEGSHHNLISSVTDEQVTAFGELFAEALGGTPETPQMAFERRLDEIRASCATNEAKDAVEYLLSRAWPV